MLGSPQPFSKKLKVFLGIFLLHNKRILVRLKQNRFKILAILLPLLLIGGFLVYKLQSQPAKPILIEGAVGTYTEDNLPLIVTRLLSQSLIVMDRAGNPKPNIASSWEVNPEATKYTVKLKKDAKWIDNTPVKAIDLDFSLPSTKVKANSDNSLTFEIADSYSPFLSLLDKPLLKRGTRIGIGPYTITKIKKDPISKVFITYVFLTSSQKDLPDLIIRFFDSEKNAQTALELGEVDALLGVNDTSKLKDQNTLNIWSRINYQQLVTIFYNTQDKVLSDESFRLALSFGAPSIPNEAEAKTSIPPTSWAFNPEVKDYLDNKELAESYLAKVENGKDSTIILTATTFLEDVGQQIVSEWNKNGIKAKLKVESGIPQNFQALLITQNIPEDPDQYSLWHSTQKQTNISKLESKRIDKDVEDGRKISDMEVRKARYVDFQRVLLDESPATFLYFPKYTAVYRTKSGDDFKKVINLQVPQL